MGARLIGLALALGAAVGVGVHIINAHSFGPEACPYGAAKTYEGGYVCLSERDLEVLAERCYEALACKTG